MPLAGMALREDELLECEVEICNTYFNIPEQEFR